MFNTTSVIGMNKIYMYTNERERERERECLTDTLFQASNPLVNGRWPEWAPYVV